MINQPVDRNRFYTNGGETRRHGLPQLCCGRHFLYKFPITSIILIRCTINSILKPSPQKLYNCPNKAKILCEIAQSAPILQTPKFHKTIAPACSLRHPMPLRCFFVQKNA